MDHNSTSLAPHRRRRLAVAHMTIGWLLAAALVIAVLVIVIVSGRLALRAAIGPGNVPSMLWSQSVVFLNATAGRVQIAPKSSTGYASLLGPDGQELLIGPRSEVCGDRKKYLVLEPGQSAVVYMSVSDAHSLVKGTHVEYTARDASSSGKDSFSVYLGPGDWKCEIVMREEGGLIVQGVR